MKNIRSLFIAFILLFAGCASIVHGTKQDINILSQPGNAKVVIYDKDGIKVHEATTPTTAKLKRGDSFFKGSKYRIEISQAGYETRTVYVTYELSGWYLAGNFCFGGLLGWLIIDPASGAMWKLDPDTVNVDLSRNLTHHDKNTNKIYIVLREEIPDGVFESLKLVQIQ